jgi:ribulose-5-phosphate 4-epimerase/fuculose-1-phosphate aldolase
VKLVTKNFVQVLNANLDTKRVFVEGEAEPSSESMLHHLIYRERPDVHAIVHVHDEFVLENAKKLGVPVTKASHPYGTVELAYEVGRILGHHTYVGVRGHGVISLGKSPWEAGKQAVAMHEAAEALSK